MVRKETNMLFEILSLTNRIHTVYFVKPFIHPKSFMRKFDDLVYVGF
jgi:hypothetical protein